MKRIRILGLCLTAVFVLYAVVATASATAAEPEYTMCAKTTKVAKKYHGKYNDKKCTQENSKGEGKYEWLPLTKADKIEGTSGPNLLFLTGENKETKELEVKDTVECQKDTVVMEIVNGHEAKLAVTYVECESKGELPGKCQSAAKAGEIHTEPLIARPVWLNEAETETGVDVKPASGKAIEHATCAGGVEEAEMIGSEIGKISPVGTATKTLTLTFAGKSKSGSCVLNGPGCAPEFAGEWESKTFHEDVLTAELTGADTFSGVPVVQSTTETASAKKTEVRVS